jgi:hypothetical protein
MISADESSERNEEIKWGVGNGEVEHTGSRGKRGLM